MFPEPTVEELHANVYRAMMELARLEVQAEEARKALADLNRRQAELKEARLRAEAAALERAEATAKAKEIADTLAAWRLVGGHDKDVWRALIDVPPKGHVLVMTNEDVLHCGPDAHRSRLSIYVFEGALHGSLELLVHDPRDTESAIPVAFDAYALDDLDGLLDDAEWLLGNDHTKLRAFYNPLDQSSRDELLRICEAWHRPIAAPVRAI